MRPVRPARSRAAWPLHTTLLLLACVITLAACGTLEVGIEYEPTVDLAGTRTVEALQTKNARLATELATLSASTFPTGAPTRIELATLTPYDTPTLIATASPHPQDEAATPSATPTTTPQAVPTASRTASPTPQATPTPACAVRADWPVYVVVRGDTLFRIAEAAGSTVAALAEANCLENPDRIFVGQRLHVPRLPIWPTVAPPSLTEAPPPTEAIEFYSATRTPEPTRAVSVTPALPNVAPSPTVTPPGAGPVP
ncbi:MAG: hypothetical protein Kow00120_30590 [Anaerolineae bacterium]